MFIVWEFSAAHEDFVPRGVFTKSEDADALMEERSDRRMHRLGPMTMEDVITHLVRGQMGTISRLRLEPGDRFVITMPESISDVTAARLKGAWRDFSDAPVLILDGGGTIGVVNGENANV